MKRRDNYSVQLGQLETRKIKDGKFRFNLSEDYWYSSKISVYAIPNLVDVIDISNRRGDIDIIVSPYPPNSWKYLYAIKVIPLEKSDKPGFVAAFTSILKEYRINILTLQSNPTFAFAPYSFWLLLDLSKCTFIDNIDEKIAELAPNSADEFHYENRLARVRLHLSNILMNLIETNNVEIRGVRFLYNFFHKMEKECSDVWHELLNTEQVKFDIEKYEGSIPRYIIDKCGLDREYIQYSIVSNPYQKSFFIIRVFGNRAVVYIDVQMEDSIGTTYNISKIISDNYGNILSLTGIMEKAVNGISHHFILFEALDINKVKTIFSTIIQRSEVKKIVIYNYDESLKGSEIESLKKYDKIEILRKNKIQQNLYDEFYYLRRFFDKDSVARVLTSKLIEAIFLWLAIIGIDKISQLLKPLWDRFF